MVHYEEEIFLKKRIDIYFICGGGEMVHQMNDNNNLKKTIINSFKL